MKLFLRVRLHRIGLGAALAALWMVWMTNLPETVLWVLFLGGLVLWIFPREVAT